MKKLLASTALATVAMSTAASAQSLLDSLLNSADVLSAQITNMAENSANLDASINISTGRDLVGINNVVSGIAADNPDGFGSVSVVPNTDGIGTNVATDFQLPDMSFIDPLTLALGDLATTGIGAMQSGAMDVSFDASGIAERTTDASTSATTTAEAITETYGDLDTGLALQNIAFNTADIDAGIALLLNDVNTTAGAVATTAIGAMGSGDLTASLTGSITDIDATAVTAGTGTSQLDSLLANAGDLSASITNLAENQGALDGAVDVTTFRNYAGILASFDAITSAVDANSLGSYASVGAETYARDVSFPDLAFLAPLEANLGNIATTAIGAMQSGSINVAFDASGLQTMTSDIATGETTTASLISETYGQIDSGLAIQNVAYNTAGVDGTVDAGINLVLADVNATVGNLGTTAIGAMGSGDLTANIVGRLVGVDAVN